MDEFGEKLLEELDYIQEARNIQEFYQNLKTDPTIKIPWVRPDLCGTKVGVAAPLCVCLAWMDGYGCPWICMEM